MRKNAEQKKAWKKKSKTKYLRRGTQKMLNDDKEIIRMICKINGAFLTKTKRINKESKHM